jgi:hypothetical protein
MFDLPPNRYINLKTCFLRRQDRYKAKAIRDVLGSRASDKWMKLLLTCALIYCMYRLLGDKNAVGFSVERSGELHFRKGRWRDRAIEEGCGCRRYFCEGESIRGQYPSASICALGAVGAGNGRRGNGGRGCSSGLSIAEAAIRIMLSPIELPRRVAAIA